MSSPERGRGSGEAFAQEHVPVTARVFIHHGHDLKSVPGVEGWRLEAERHEKHLRAAAPTRLRFCGSKEPGPQSPRAPRLLHPELANFGAATPRVSADAGDNPTLLVPHEDRQPLAARNPGRGGVELVDPILQILNVAWRWLGNEFRSLV